MAASMNRVILVGNLAKDPELKHTQGGTAVVSLRMATNRQFLTKGGEKREEVCWVTVVVWGKQAEAVAQYLKKGSPLLVEGRLQNREWEKDGQKHSILEVVAERTQFLGSGNGKSKDFEPDAPAPDDSDVPF